MKQAKGRRTQKPCKNRIKTIPIVGITHIIFNNCKTHNYTTNKCSQEDISGFKLINYFITRYQCIFKLQY